MTSAEEVTSTVAETSTLNKVLLFSLILSGLIGGASADYYYYDQGNSMGDWSVPQFDSQEQLVQQFVAPFLFIVVLLQFSLRKALAFTFAKDDEYDQPFTRNEKPNVSKEATVMAIAIALMMVASPYWSWVQAFATGIGLLAMSGLVLVFMFLIYLFVRP